MPNIFSPECNISILKTAEEYLSRFMVMSCEAKKKQHACAGALVSVKWLEWEWEVMVR